MKTFFVFLLAALVGSHSAHASPSAKYSGPKEFMHWEPDESPDLPFRSPYEYKEIVED